MEGLETSETRHRPVTGVLKDWGNAHGFAGSGDRAAIANLVFDALRWRASSSWLMGTDSARAVVLSVLVRRWGWNVDVLGTLLESDDFGPGALGDGERAGLANVDLGAAPEAAHADVPEWVVPHLQATFGDDWIAEAAALAARAPIDLRANLLKAPREKVLKALSRFGAVPTPHSPRGVRTGVGPSLIPL